VGSAKLNGSLLSLDLNKIRVVAVLLLTDSWFQLTMEKARDANEVEADGWHRK